MIKRLMKALAFLAEGEKLFLGDDTFLTGLLDGSDKIYGFANEGGQLVVISSNMHNYTIGDLDEGDLNYIFNLSGIYRKILLKMYKVTSETPEEEEERHLLEDELIDAVIDEIKRDLEAQDTTALFELLSHSSFNDLVQYLPEEKWETFDKLKQDKK